MSIRRQASLFPLAPLPGGLLNPKATAGSHSLTVKGTPISVDEKQYNALRYLAQLVGEHR